MKHQELKDNINGSLLKRDYLEAFLMQSAYLEAVLKYIADFNIFTATNDENISIEKAQILSEIRKSYKKKSVYELTSFLHNANTGRYV